ncbi:hypothetical protein FM076_13355 [Streptomyces albus subsp. chlorinus]|uniref:hypothetical protein n=1 Tax=Streptomyces albus TaxID=1888 RepID=UPI00156D47D5|nr:hypothetical protein [Streptomyces albus]NSC22123.1 hypothetical protein [Streptomyces albus subsp. chlorinus]
MTAEMSEGEMEVSVELSDCACEDAEAVFRVLSGLFPSDWGELRPEGRKANVWLSRFDVTREAAQPDVVPLGSRVTAELQGSPYAVERLHRTLLEAFGVVEVLEVAGDQEKQLRLRLESR